MDMQTMNTITNSVNATTGSNNLTGTLAGAGGLIGAGVGSVVPVVGTMTGAVIGSSVGGLVGAISDAVIPTYSTIRGSTSGFNFTNNNLYPIWIEYICPSDSEAERLDKYYKYFGCATNRLEPLNTASYMYDNHAFIKGVLLYNNSIPLDKFQQINNIFQNGVHIIK